MYCHHPCTLTQHFKALFFFFYKLRMHHLSCAFSLCSTLKSSLRKIEVLRFIEIFGNGWNGFRQHHCGPPPGSIAQSLESFEVGVAWSGRQVSLIRPSHRRRTQMQVALRAVRPLARTRSTAKSKPGQCALIGKIDTALRAVRPRHGLGPPPRASQGSAPSLAKLIQLFGQCAHGKDSVHSAKEQSQGSVPSLANTVQVGSSLGSAPTARTRSTAKSKARVVCPHWQIQLQVALRAVRPCTGTGTDVVHRQKQCRLNFILLGRH